MTSPNQKAGPVDPTSLAPTDPESARDSMISMFQQQTSNLTDNTNYYNATARPAAVGISVPPEMQALLAQVGYPRLYIDSLSARLTLEGFRMESEDDADTQLQDWWEANDLDVEAPLGHTEALIHGRAYITIAAPDPATDFNVDLTVPIIRVEPPTTLYAIIEPRTRTVLQAIRVITGATGTSQDGQTVGATLYDPNTTTAWIFDPNNGGWQAPTVVPHNLGVVPVVPITNRTMLSDLYGTSEITPELRSVTDAAARILMDMQGAAELMGIPQRLLFGVRPQDIGVDPTTGQQSYDAYMARILAFEAPEGKAFQFNAAELRNFADALDQLDRKAAAYTGLPPQYLSYSSENPASAEAIESSEARLVKNAERKALIFGGAWEQAMRIAYAVMNGGIQGLPPQYYRMETIWQDPSTPTYAAKAAAAAALYAGGIGVIPKERARVDMGYSVAEREQMQMWDQQESAAAQLAGMFAPPSAPGGSGGASAPKAISTKPTQTVDATSSSTTSADKTSTAQ